MARCVYIAIFGSSTKQLPFPEVWSPAGPDWATPVGPFWRIQSASSFWPFFHPHIPFSKLQSLKYRTTNKTGIKRAVSSLHRQDRLNYLTVYYITQRHPWIQNCRQNAYDVFNLTMPLQNDLNFMGILLNNCTTTLIKGRPSQSPFCAHRWQSCFSVPHDLDPRNGNRLAGRVQFDTEKLSWIVNQKHAMTTDYF